MDSKPDTSIIQIKNDVDQNIESTGTKILARAENSMFRLMLVVLNVPTGVIFIVKC